MYFHVIMLDLYDLQRAVIKMDQRSSGTVRELNPEKPLRCLNH